MNAGKGGPSIYELAAMQAGANDVPDEAVGPDVDNTTRVECRSCGRKFNENAIMKHEKIC